MKKAIKRFYERQKKILFLMIITLVSFLINILALFLVMVNRPEAVTNFIETSEITSEILPFSILSFSAMGLGIVLLVLIMVFVVKMIIPDTKALSGLIMKDEAEFLLDLPNRIRKEVFKNGK